MRRDSSPLVSSSTLDMAATPSRVCASEAVRDPTAPVCPHRSLNDPKTATAQFSRPD